MKLYTVKAGVRGQKKYDTFKFSFPMLVDKSNPRVAMDRCMKELDWEGKDIKFLELVEDGEFTFESHAIFTKSQFPDEFAEDFSYGGQKDAICAYWRDQIKPEINRGDCIKYVQSFGAHEDDELSSMSNDDLTDWVIWQIGSSFNEEDPDTGKPSLFCME